MDKEAVCICIHTHTHTHTHTPEYYLAIKKIEILPYVTTWMDLDSIRVSDTYAAQRWSGELLRGDTPHARLGVVAERRYSMCKVSSSVREEIPHVQGKEQQLRFPGAAMKRYPTSKVGETPVRQ